MENPKVKFRRGGSNLPETITDGYITFDTTRGSMYVDTGTTRKAVNGTLFGVSQPSRSENCVVRIDGVPEYFNGMSVTVVFDFLSKDEYSGNQVELAITDGEMALPYAGAMRGSSVLKVGDIENGVPYAFTFYEGSFFLVSGGNPRWNGI